MQNDDGSSHMEVQAENIVADAVTIHYFNSDLDTEAARRARELTDTVNYLRGELEAKTAELRLEKSDAIVKAETIRELQAIVARLTEKENLALLLGRVNKQAQSHLLTSEGFYKQFLEPTACSMYVMAVDIRRSTELMLKARSPQGFATFITVLCRELESIVKDCYGVFDKFTGDGVLAFFPEFFSGVDAGYYVLQAAMKCHAAFHAKYREYRSSFTTVLNDVGLGIGIDYGPAHLVHVAGGLTAVGGPVVYACRLGAAPADKTLLNQPAYEKVTERFGTFFFIREINLEIKREGSMLAYEISPSGREYTPDTPTWTVGQAGGA